ncbi:hypothetical protein [Spectribacter hydrogenoxidans]|uniref:HemN C-terminal domain-containing protein n=1 Tax=Spectribacter hydrogenoxidans TaxID=3075608 RepID=A0ABU3BZV3_9GAMM|nr:hypothetical protein [Salinisphaera sp. W335]MDT0634848.1 hypothetical protein [Salinisphaera sp. W335]
MCLEPEFFEARARYIERCVAHGEQTLEDWLETTGWMHDDLVQAGLLAPREIASTADLIDHRLTAAGRRYLRSPRGYEVLLVRAGRAQRLGSRLASSQ